MQPQYILDYYHVTEGLSCALVSLMQHCTHVIGVSGAYEMIEVHSFGTRAVPTSTCVHAIDSQQIYAHFISRDTRYSFYLRLCSAYGQHTTSGLTISPDSISDCIMLIHCGCFVCVCVYVYMLLWYCSLVHARDEP